MKRFLSILLAVLMLAVMLPVTAMAADGYVTVTITYNGEFSIAKADAVTAAEATINGQQYSTLKAAQDAFAALFADNAALFTRYDDPTKTVDKVTYSVYGAVEAGTDKITLSAGPVTRLALICWAMITQKSTAKFPLGQMLQVVIQHGPLLKVHLM